MKGDENLDNLLYCIGIGCRVTKEDFVILQNEIAELRHYRDTTKGLYCIDRNPSEVSIEWIKENAFQI